jgi:hypothetical protein
LRKLVIVLVVLLAGAWLVVEIVSIPVGERMVEERVAERNENAATVTADIDSFPLVTRVLLTGNVKELTVTLDEVARQAVTFAQVRFEFAGIEIDRSSLRGGDFRVTAIDRGTITATIDLGAVGGALGRIATRAGLDVRVSGRTLFVGPASIELSSELLPCDPDARIEGDQVVLSCTIDEVPEALIEAAQRR